MVTQKGHALDIFWMTQRDTHLRFSELLKRTHTWDILNVVVVYRHHTFSRSKPPCPQFLGGSYPMRYLTHQVPLTRSGPVRVGTILEWLMQQSMQWLKVCPYASCILIATLVMHKSDTILSLNICILGQHSVGCLTWNWHRRNVNKDQIEWINGTNLGLLNWKLHGSWCMAILILSH